MKALVLYQLPIALSLCERGCLRIYAHMDDQVATTRRTSVCCLQGHFPHKYKSHLIITLSTPH